MLTCSWFCAKSHSLAPPQNPAAILVRQNARRDSCLALRQAALAAKVRKDFVFELDLIFIRLFWDKKIGLRALVSRNDLVAGLSRSCGASASHCDILADRVIAVWLACRMIDVNNDKLVLSKGAHTLLKTMSTPKWILFNVSNRSGRIAARVFGSPCLL